MKKIYSISKVVMSAVILMVSLTLSAQTHITDRAGLEAIANDLTGSYILDNDIDLSGADWVPLGSFSGTLDGDGHKILNLTINLTENGEVGFFTKIDYGGDNSMTVKNLGFVNANVTCGKQNVGIIAGKTGPATFENCWVESGKVSGKDWGVGSFVGNAYGITITKCYSYAEVYGNAGHVGGLVGDLNGGKVEDCNYWGKVTNDSGAPAAGGIVGWVHDTQWSPLKESTVSRCYAKGIVEGINGGWATSGIVGIDDIDDVNSPLTVTDCIAAQDSLNPAGNRILVNFKSSQYINVVNCFGTTFAEDTLWKAIGANNLDGSSITEAQFKDQTFYTDSLPNWNFGGFVDPVWEMKEEGPLLVNQIAPPTIPSAIRRLEMTSSKAKVYSSNGKVYVKDAEKSSTIRFFNLAGQMIQQSTVKSNLETFQPKEKGMLIIEISSPKARGTYKVFN